MHWALWEYVFLFVRVSAMHCCLHAPPRRSTYNCGHETDRYWIHDIISTLLIVICGHVQRVVSNCRACVIFIDASKT